jgi:hypothetical protein
MEMAKSGRPLERSVLILLFLHPSSEHSLIQLRPSFLAPLQTVLNLFSTPTTSPLAKAELKKIMTTRGVRKTIMDAIIPKVFGTSIEEKGHAHVEASTAAPEPVSNGNGHAGPEVVEESTGEIEVVYIASDRDLEAEFASMFPPFEVNHSPSLFLRYPGSLD